MRVYDYSDFIALRLYDSLSTVACPPSSTLVESIFWPQFDLDLISRKSYLSLFEGHFFFSGRTDRLRNQSESWISRYDESQISKTSFFSFFLQFTFSPSTRKKTQKSETKEKFGALTGRLEKTCDESYSFGSLSEYRVRNRAERKKIKSRKNHKKE